MPSPEPPFYPFVIPDTDRALVTQETEPAGDHHDPHHQDIDWIGHAQQGGGSVPEDFEWRSNPKQDQDEGNNG